MAFWSGETLKERCPYLITPYADSAIDCAAYTLHLGGQAFTSGDNEAREASLNRGQTPGLWNVEVGKPLTIRAGQFAFLLTEESVKVPSDAVGFISIKAKHKFKGLVNVSGFHVDPGWSGHLIFAVFNAGPKELVFERGEALFLLFYSRLDRESNVIKSDSKKQEQVPNSLIEHMSSEVPSLFKLSQAAKDMKVTTDETAGRANVAMAIAGGAFTLALAAISITVAVAIKTIFSSDGDQSPVVRNYPVPASGAPALSPVKASDSQPPDLRSPPSPAPAIPPKP